MTSSEELSAVHVDVCQRQAGYGCELFGGEVMKQSMNPEQYAAWQAGQVVEINVDGTKVAVERTGCLNCCSRAAAACVTIGPYDRTITFSDAGEFQTKMRELMERTPQQWDADEASLRRLEQELERRLEEFRQTLREKHGRKGNCPPESQVTKDYP